jgi:hypothetical protein
MKLGGETGAVISNRRCADEARRLLRGNQGCQPACCIGSAGAYLFFLLFVPALDEQILTGKMNDGVGITHSLFQGSGWTSCKAHQVGG